MWYKEISKDSDVVISTRLRFARSIDGYKFPNIMKKKEKQNLLDKVKNSINLKEYNFFKTEDIDETTLGSLVEVPTAIKATTKKPISLENSRLKPK